MSRLLLGALLLLSGCARNAIFELELELPPQPAGAPLFAVVQLRNDAGFDADWSGVGLVSGIPLTACSRPSPAPECELRDLDPACANVVSVIGDEDDLTRPLRVRVRFCQDATCGSPADASAPEARIEIERALYTGAYTQGRACIDAVPAMLEDPIRIERCDVRCREGDAVTHCRADGTHFCEDPR